MKLLDLSVEKLGGVADGRYSFAEVDGSPRDVVVLAGDTATVLLETIAALLEAVRGPAGTPRKLAWWARRRGLDEARLRARWALSEGEAALARARGRTLTLEWRFGPHDDLPCESQAEGAASRLARADLARYVHVDANGTTMWKGGPVAMTMVEALARIAERDIAATRACCYLGVGLVALKTPNELAELSRALAPILPTLRVERIPCSRGERPVACFRGEQRVEPDQLAEVERDAIRIVTALHTANVRDGVVLVDRPELHVPLEDHGLWLTWLAALAAGNQLFVAPASRETSDAPADSSGTEHARRGERGCE
jgi:hypothetical protein